MPSGLFIQVILPLRLDWEPWYRTVDSSDVGVGTRVRVRFSGREYVAVVSSVGGTPDIEMARVQEIVCVEPRLERISDAEIRFWRFIASYYLCTLGEVYKFVYPSGKTAVEAKRANRKGSLSQEIKTVRPDKSDKQALRAILDAFVDHQPVLLEGRDRERIHAELARRTLEGGRDVLLLRPGAPHSSYVRQREMAKIVRGDAASVVGGGKELLFLPFSKLGLIIVDDEHSQSFKHSGVAPRFHARDAAVALALQHGADVLLSSATPSLESFYNARSGKYAHVVKEGACTVNVPEIIDTEAEFKKMGMVGQLSRKLIERIEAVPGRKLVIAPWPLDAPLEYRRLKTIRLQELQSEQLDKYDLVVLLNAEALLGGDDFRADEKALQILSRLSDEVKGEFVIQTRESGHPVFSTDRSQYRETLLAERKEFGFPPFSRMLQVVISDTNDARSRKMKPLLEKSLGGSLRILLPKDRELAARKASVASAVADFEKEKNYRGHIVIDVDP